MSRGGGRGGRGRGRWSSRGNVTSDLIRDNLDDLGMDQNQLIDDKSPPVLYPHTTDVPPPPFLNEEEMHLVHIAVNLKSRLFQSKDRIGGDISVLDEQLFSPAEWAPFIPQELLASSSSAKGRSLIGKKKGDDLFTNLEKAESGVKVKRETSLQAGSDDEEEKEEADALAEEAELEEDDDYMADHYQSDGDMMDDGGDGEGEAIF